MTDEERKCKWSRPKSKNPNWRGGTSGPAACVDCGKTIRAYRTRCQVCSNKGSNNPFYNKKHSSSTKQKIRESRLGNYVGGQEKRIKINDVEYKSCSEAARALNVSPSTITYRVKNNWSGYILM